MNYHTAKDMTGKYTQCQRSPKRHGAPPSGAVVVTGIDRWEDALERSARLGYEYAVSEGCSSNGFSGRASWTYYRLARRLRPATATALS